MNDLHERFDEIEKLQAARRKSWISRVKRDLGLKDRKLMDLKQKAEEIQAKIEESTVEEARLTSSGFATEERMQQKLDAIGGDLHENEENFVEKNIAPLEKEQKKELLKFDNLAKLSTREYLDLWKGLNPFYLSHVTRQGYRDHGTLVYHTAGMGEFHDGFTGISKMLTPSSAELKLCIIWDIWSGRTICGS